MTNFLLAACGFVLIVVAVGLVRILSGPTEVNRMMTAQLFATGGIATLLLLAAGAGAPAALDVALTLALLTAFAPVAFVKSASRAYWWAVSWLCGRRVYRPAPLAGGMPVAVDSGDHSWRTYAKRLAQYRAKLRICP